MLKSGKKNAERVLHDVKKGCISDPIKIPLYTLESQDKVDLKSIIALEKQTLLKDLFIIKSDEISHLRMQLLSWLVLFLLIFGIDIIMLQAPF